MPFKHNLPQSTVDEMVSMYYAGSNTPQIAKKYGLSEWKVLDVLRKAGTKMRRRTRTRSLNDNAFDDWNDNAQYWAGFLCSDGCVKMHGTGKAICLKLSQKDEDHLMLFRDFMGSSHAVERQDDNGWLKVTVRFRSDPIYDLFDKHGLTGPKEHKNPSDFLVNSRHFWRGVLDADGCIQLGNGSPKVICYAWHPLVDKFYAFCQNNDCILNSKINDTVSISNFSVSGTRASKLCSILYTDCDHCLTRKKALAIQAMKYISSNPPQSHSTSPSVAART